MGIKEEMTTEKSDLARAIDYGFGLALGLAGGFSLFFCSTILASKAIEWLIK